MSRNNQLEEVAQQYNQHLNYLIPKLEALETKIYIEITDVEPDYSKQDLLQTVNLTFDMTALGIFEKEETVYLVLQTENDKKLLLKNKSMIFKQKKVFFKSPLNKTGNESNQFFNLGFDLESLKDDQQKINNIIQSKPTKGNKTSSISLSESTSSLEDIKQPQKLPKQPKKAGTKPARKPQKEPESPPPQAGCCIVM